MLTVIFIIVDLMSKIVQDILNELKKAYNGFHQLAPAKYWC